MNTFIGKSIASLVLVSGMIISTSAYAATVYVDATATGLGDGTSQVDAFTTIDAAINSASTTTGDLISVSGAQTITSTITVNKSVTIQGVGATISTSGTNQVFTITSSDVTIRDFSFTKTDKNGVHNLIGIQASNASVLNNTFTGQYVIGDGDVSRAIVVSPAVTGFTISGNSITGFRQPAYIDASTGTVANNYVAGSRGWVVLSDANVTFTGNTWSGNVFDIAFIPGATNNYTDIVAIRDANNNAAIENQFGGTPVLATVYVDGSVTTTGNGTEASPYKTIAEAIPRVTAHGTIKVAAGTYVENILINKPLLLEGANAGVLGNGTRGAETIIDGNDNAVIQIATSSVTIDGFTITKGAGALNAGIHIPVGASGSWTITNNIITDNSEGIYANCVASCTISNNLFDANNRTGSGSADDIGIYAESTNGLTVTNNEFKNHTLGNPILFALVATPSHVNTVVSNNNFHDNTYSAVYALGMSNAEFTGNTFTAVDATGLSLSGGNDDVYVYNNTFTGSARGIRVNDDYGTNTNIEITENSFVGTASSILGDTLFSIGVLGSGYTGVIPAPLNYYDAATGPYSVNTNPNGTGGEVLGDNFVNFSPWYPTPAKDSLGFATVVSGATSTGYLPVGIVRTSSGATLEMASGTTLTSAASWDGMFTFPASVSGYTIIPSQGTAATDITQFSVGSVSSHILLSSPIKLVFPGFTTKKVAIGTPGAFTIITNVCDSLTTPTLSSTTTDQCKFVDNNNLVVWTNHTGVISFYTELVAGGNGGSSSGGSFSSGGSSTGGQVLGVSTSTTPVATTTVTTVVTGTTTTPTLPNTTGGQVLGASTHSFMFNLGYGARGLDVIELHKFLIAQGYLKIAAPTGWFGPLTRAAVTKWQQDNRIPATGFFGPISRAFLNAKNAQ